ncbi:MAG: hypothetical protein ACREDT_15685, partial [Methylocella sp.]
LNPLPLPVAQPKQIPAHNFKSFPPKNHYLIVSAKGLMSSNPSFQAMSKPPPAGLVRHQHLTPLRLSTCKVVTNMSPLI